MARAPTRPSPIRIELLAKHHDRAAFTSLVEPLDRYFKTQASQDMRRRISTCFVAVEVATGTLAGYYTLAASGIPLDELPDDIARRLPRYPVIPAGLLGRLAVASAHQGKGLGKAMLVDSIRRIAAAELMAFALLVDAKDDRAQQFYEHFGFVRLAGSGRRLALPIATALPLIKPGP